MNILRIALNDVRVALKFKMTLVWWVALPMVFIFIFSLIIGDYTSDGTWLPVFKHDNHELADVFIEQLECEGYWVQTRSLKDQQHIHSWPRALIIPKDFSQKILNGERVDLTLTEGGGDGREKNLAARALLIKALIKLNTAIAAVDLIERGWSEATKEELKRELDKAQILTVETRQHESLKPPPSGAAFTLPAYLVMFAMMMTIIYGGVSLAYDRKEKRIARLAAAPVSFYEIFLGKLLGGMLQPILQGVILIGLGATILQIDLGKHPLALVPVLATFAFFCGSIGMLSSLLARTEQQIIGLGILISNVLAPLGGCWWPLEIVPDTFKTVALFTPSYWAVQGIQDVMYFGKSWLDILPECAVLFALGAALTLIAAPLFHRD